MEPMRIGIIGTGVIVSLMHWPVLALLPEDFRVVSLCNQTRAKAERLADVIQKDTGVRPSIYEGYQRMLACGEIDAVLLALPTSLNPEVAEAALSCGCHVIAEKPIAANLTAAKRMLPWPKRYGCVLMIAENYRYIPAYRRAAGLIGEGIIGEPKTARWSLHAYIGPGSPFYTPWRLRPEHLGGYLSDGGVHEAAVFRMLLGEVESVSGVVCSIRPDLPPADTVSAILRFANGALGTYAKTYALPGPNSPLEVAGKDGVLLVWQDRVELWREGAKAQEWDEPLQYNGAVEMYKDFAQAVRGGIPSRSTPAEALADLQLIAAILRASETGKEVHIPEIR